MNNNSSGRKDVISLMEQQIKNDQQRALKQALGNANNIGVQVNNGLHTPTNSMLQDGNDMYAAFRGNIESTNSSKTFGLNNYAKAELALSPSGYQLFGPQAQYIQETFSQERGRVSTSLRQQNIDTLKRQKMWANAVNISSSTPENLKDIVRASLLEAANDQELTKFHPNFASTTSEEYFSGLARKFVQEMVDAPYLTKDETAIYNQTSKVIERLNETIASNKKILEEITPESNKVLYGKLSASIKDATRELKAKEAILEPIAKKKDALDRANLYLGQLYNDEVSDELLEEATRFVTVSNQAYNESYKRKIRGIEDNDARAYIEELANNPANVDKKIEKKLVKVNPQQVDELISIGELFDGDNLVSELKLRNLSSGEFNEAVSKISDPTLRNIVGGMYAPEALPDGTVRYRGREVIGLHDTAYKSGLDGTVTTLRGLFDLPGIELDVAQTYLKEEDAYGKIAQYDRAARKFGETTTTRQRPVFDGTPYVDKNGNERVKFSRRYTTDVNGKQVPVFENVTGVEGVYADGLFRKIKAFQDGQNKKTISERRALYTSIYNGTNENVSIEGVIYPLMQQQMDDKLQMKATEFHDLMARYGEIVGAYNNNDLNQMNKLITGGMKNDGFAIDGAGGMAASGYRRALEEMGLPAGTEFASLTQDQQLKATEIISNKATEKMEGAMSGLSIQLNNFNKDVDKKVKALKNVVYDQSSSVYEAEIEYQNTFNRGISEMPGVSVTTEMNGGGITDDGPTRIRRKVEVIGEDGIKDKWGDIFESKMIPQEEQEALLAAMEAQEFATKMNLQNSITDMTSKDYEGIKAYTKGRGTVREVTPLAYYGDRNEKFITYSEWEQGFITSRDEIVPIEAIREYHGLKSATDLMNSKPADLNSDIPHRTGTYMFTEEEWRSGVMKIGDRTIPIDEFEEYYDKGVRTFNELRINQSDAINSRLSNNKVVGELEYIDARKVLDTKIGNTNLKVGVRSNARHISGGIHNADVIHTNNSGRAERDILFEMMSRMRSGEEIPQDQLKKYKKQISEMVSLEESSDIARDVKSRVNSVIKDYENNADTLYASIDNALEVINKPKKPTNFKSKYSTGVTNYNAFVANLNAHSSGIVGEEELRKIMSQISNSEPITSLPEAQKAMSILEQISTSARDKKIDVSLSSEEMMKYERLFNNNSVGKVFVPNVTDKRINTLLSNASKDGKKINVARSKVNYDVVNVDGDVVTMKAHHMIVNDAKISLEYDGDSLLESLLEYDRITNSKGAGSYKNAREALEDITGHTTIKSGVQGESSSVDTIAQRLNQVVGTFEKDGKEITITKRNILDFINSDTVIDKMTDGTEKTIVKGQIPLLVKNAAEVNFSWIGSDKRNIPELKGIAFEALTEVVADTNPEDIKKAFTGRGMTLADLVDGEKKALRDVMADAFGYNIGVKTMLSYVNKDGGGDKGTAHSLIRILKKSIQSETGEVPDVDRIRDGLYAMRDGLMGPKNEVARDLFLKDIDALIASPDSIREHLLDNGDTFSTDIIEVIESLYAQHGDDEFTLNDVINNVAELLKEQASTDENVSKWFEGSNVTDAIYTDVASRLVYNDKELMEKIEGVAGFSKDSYDPDKVIQEFSERTGRAIRKKKGQIGGGYEEMLDNIPNSFALHTDKEKIARGEAIGIINTYLDKIEDSGNLSDTIKTAFKREFVTKGADGEEIIKTTRDLILEDVLKSFTKENQKTTTMTKNLKRSINKNIDRALEQQFISELSGGELFDILAEMNKANPGYASAYIQANGGIIKTFSKMFGVDESEVGNLDVIQKAFGNLEAANVKDLKKFSLLRNFVPGLKIGVQGMDSDGNFVKGYLSELFDADKMPDGMVTLDTGESIKLLNSADEAITNFNTTNYKYSDFRYSNENVARKHYTPSIEDGATKYNTVAGLNVSYDVASRRGFRNTGFIDPVANIKNYNDFRFDTSKTGVVFDFETTGLPKSLDGKRFAPVEFSYMKFNAKQRTADGKLHIDRDKNKTITKYAKPNNEVKKMFKEALADDSYAGLFTTKKGNVGSDNANFMLMKNYAKYDDTMINLGGKNYPLGALLTSDMSLNKETGNVLSYIGDEVIDTQMKPYEVVEQIKKSGKSVFDYLASGGSKENPKFGINKKDIMAEKAFVRNVLKVMDSSDYLIGHNISTADIPWAQQWFARLDLDGELKTKLEDKIIDTQDLQQAVQPGRLTNRLSDHAIDKSKSHLAHADIETNIELFNKLGDMSSTKALEEQVKNGISDGDYIMKVRKHQLGMHEIPEGLYQLKGISQNPETKEGLLTLLDTSTGKEKTFSTENLATLNKELADNWVGYGTDLETAQKHLRTKLQDDVNRTIYNAYGSIEAVHRYKTYNDEKAYKFAKELMIDMHNAYELAANPNRTDISSTINLSRLANTVDEGRFVSKTASDLEIFVLNNADRLTGDGFKREMGYLTKNLEAHRTDEMKMVAGYFDTDEGKLVEKYLKKGQYRQKAGHLTPGQRQEYADSVYKIVKGVKESNPSVAKYTTIDGKYNVGTIKGHELPGWIKGTLGAKAIDRFKEKDVIIDMSNASTIESSIWGAGERLEKMLLNKAETITGGVRKRVTNEVILPMLSPYITDEALKKSVEQLAKGNKPDDEFFSTVHSVAAHLAENKNVLTADGGLLANRGYRVLDMSDGISKGQHQVIYNELEKQLKENLLKLDSSIVSKEIDVNGVKTLVATPGGLEALGNTIDIIKANEQGAIAAIANSDKYKQLANELGYDPIAEGVDLLSFFDKSADNSYGIPLMNKLDIPSEYRRGIEKPEDIWMAYWSADDLINIAHDIRVINGNGKMTEIANGFIDKADEKILQRYKKDYPDIIEFIQNEFEVDHIEDIANITNITAERVKQMQEAFNKKTGVNNMYTNRSTKKSIMNELWLRATDNKDYKDYANKIITPETIANDPLKYNAMKAIGLIQPVGDNSGNYYTGQIATPKQYRDWVDKAATLTGEDLEKHMSRRPLDPGKVLVAGNKKISYSRGGVSVKNAQDELAGMPLANLTRTQLEGVVESEYTRAQHTTLLTEYLDRVKRENYDNFDGEAIHRYDQYVVKARQKPMTSPVMQQVNIIEQINQNALDTQHVNIDNTNQAERVAEASMKKQAKKSSVKNVDPSDIAQEIVSITDHPNVVRASEAIGTAKKTAKEILSGIDFNNNLFKYGALGLGIGMGLNLMRQRPSDGGRPEDRPRRNQAPRVDGSYDSEYNGGRRPTIGSQTVRLEEFGKGLNISARGKNRKGLSDMSLNQILSQSFGSNFGSNVNISYQDDRSTIDNAYVQNLVSNALFG